MQQLDSSGRSVRREGLFTRMMVRTAPYHQYIATFGLVGAATALISVYVFAVGTYIAYLWNASIGNLFGLRKMNRKEGLALFCLAQALFRPSWRTAPRKEKKQEATTPSWRDRIDKPGGPQHVGLGAKTILGQQSEEEAAAQFVATMEALLGKPKLD